MTDMTIPNRTLFRRGSARGHLSTMHLEEVRDLLARVDEKQDPRDYERSLNQLHVGFLGGQMMAQFLTPDGLDDTRMPVTHTGAGQLAREVLPSRFFGGLKDLAALDEGGDRLATMAWARFAKEQTNPRFIRTVRMKLDGEVRRVVRSCHSTNYAPYSNLQFVQDILDHGGKYANMPVLDWRLTDNGMRLRFATAGEEGIQLNVPCPMVEAWNGETGMSRTKLRAGIYKLICTNGMGSWDDKTEFGWIHSGDPERIQLGVKDAFDNLLTTANGVVGAYNEALTVSIDDAYEWMMAELTGHVPDRVIVEAQKALTHETTTPGGKLASVVDAITLVAQDEEDMFDQYEVERVAARVLSRGRAVALRNGGRIPVEA
jgi:hypothetical protein